MEVNKYRVYDLRKREKTLNEKLARWMADHYPLLFTLGIIMVLVIFTVIHIQGRPDFLLQYGSV
jgi:hypothetical protein